MTITPEKEALARINEQLSISRGTESISASIRCDDLDAVLALLSSEREVVRLRGALAQVKHMLTIPAAEYVPAIPDVWAAIDEALR